MSSFVTGQIIEARCSRCKDITGHVVMACLSGVPVKVECRACGSVHKYVAPEAKSSHKTEKPVLVKAGHKRTEAVDATIKAGHERKAASSAAGTRAAQQASRKQEENEQRWNNAIARIVSSSVPYTMQGTFDVDTLIEHPVFGMGVVVELLPPDKMDVLFREGVKRLRCAC